MTTTKRLHKPNGFALCGILLTLAVSAGAGLWQHNSNVDSRKALFALLNDEFSALVSQRFELYQYGLRAARGAIVAGGEAQTPRYTFIDYFNTRDLPTEFPGARGVGYIERVPQDKVESFVADARADGFDTFAVRELSSNQSERFLIKFIYPLKGNEGATGLDIASETNRRTAAQEAARTGMVRLTAPITLVQASGQTNHGFLILMPIYQAGADISTPEKRLEHHYGWSYSPLVASEVLGDLGPRRDEVGFSITDVGDGTEFFLSPGFDSDRVVTSREIQVFGRTWQLRFHTLPAFDVRHRMVNPFYLSAGLGLSGLVLVLGGYGLLRNRERTNQLRAQEEEFAYKLVDAAPMALLVVDEDGAIIRANAYCENLFGWKPGELTGHSIDELVPANARAGHAALRASYDHALRNMAARREVEAVTIDGTIFPVAVRLSPLRIGNRQLVVAGVNDITKEKHAIQVLTASQQRWQEMANSLPQLIWTCDASGACDFLSEQWEKYTGIPAEEQLGFKWLEQVHPDDRARLEVAWNKSVIMRRSFVIEFRVRKKGGAYRWFYTRAEPILDKDGNIERWIGSNTDIEDKNAAEEQVRALLADLEQRVADRTDELNTALKDLQNVLDAVPSMIGYWDRDLRNRLANNAYFQWYGKTPEWLKGRHMSELLGDDGFEKVRHHAEEALEGKPQQFERNIVDHLGKPRSIQVHYLPDTDKGEVLGFYLLAFDVTAIKESEVAQKEAREAAENATRAKSAFLTSMSHEFRTPMNSILGFTDLLIGQHFGTLNEKQLEHAGRIRQSGEHLLNLMDGVLELSKIEAGRISISVEPISVVATVKSVVANLEILAAKYQVEIRLKRMTDAQVYVKADITRLTQILINLGSNAIKYNRPGGWVEFSLEKKPDGMTRIIVLDNGLGIPKHRQKDAFQPFNRMGAEQGKIEGSGIGLALVRNYAELMGGSVGFSSVEGEGTEFWLDLQSVDPAEVRIPKAAADNAEIDISAANKPLRVLYVEDNEFNRALFKNYMETFPGVELLEAEDGVTGLSIAKAERPDLIFLDINLPGLNGYDVLQEIRADETIKATRVAALTANAMSGDAETGLAAGFDEYLTKPIRLDQLSSLVAQARQRLIA